MTSEQFAYWLQGFVELNGGMPTEGQWESIKDHLETVFVKITPQHRGFDLERLSKLPQDYRAGTVTC